MSLEFDKDMALNGATPASVGSYQMIFGYLDPGTGSLILQAALGGIAGIAVAFKAWKARLMSKKAVAAAEDTETTTDESAVTSES